VRIDHDGPRCPRTILVEETAMPAHRPRPLTRHANAATAAVLVLCLGLVSAAQAAPGDLDPTFSGDGKSITDFGGNDEAFSVALQPDGKIVAVGGTGVDFALARYNPDGSLDPSFSGDGKQTTDFGAGDRASGLVLQSDGKIVALGYTLRGGGGQDFALARYNPDGSLDPSFSGDGKQTTDFGGTMDEARDVALQPDGKIVAVGSAFGDARDFALARYTPDGSLDATFSADGKQSTDLGADDAASSVAIQFDGKIVAAGYAGGGDFESPTDFALARYNSDGSLDASFSGSGVQSTDLGGDDAASGVALQPDGKIVAVGYAGPGGVYDFALTRYNPDGSLDPSFSGDGKQTTHFDGNDAAWGVALQSDGKIVAVGHAGVGARPGDFALARYNADGSLDPTLSVAGKQTTDFGWDDAAHGVALEPDDKIVAVGITGPMNGGRDFALARYQGGSGAPDATPPSVSISAPVDGSTVPAAVTVSASASDNVGVASVEFYADGVAVGTDTAPLDCGDSYCVEWNATGLSGQHTLTAVARDAAGNATTSAPVTVTVEAIAPLVSISRPEAGSTVSGLVTVSADASDNVGVIEVAFWRDVDPVCPFCGFGEEEFLGSDRLAPYSVEWNTSPTFNGRHTLTALAFDAAGNVTISADVPVTVNNLDTTPPSVSISAPVAGATVSGLETVSAVASDNAGVAGVQFKLDGANLGAEDATAPYSFPWDTTTFTNGSHTLTAVARDAAGNATTSAAVAVNVSNAPPPPPPCADTVRISRAEYSSGARELRVEATSTIAGAILTVWNATGTETIGRLTEDGGGRYRGQFKNIANPVTIRVTTDRNPCETDEARVGAK
jgi:uncharacterized delta-60 repeat protein